MTKQYLPKIKATVAKNIAKNLLSTKSGKKVSDTKFKDFLKKEKDLKKFAYTGKGSTLAKHQAKKFFNKVTQSAKTSGAYRINPSTAKKMGLKINKQGQLSTIGLNKVYQQATTEELKTQQKPTGPSLEEQRKEKRREKALKTLHKQERAKELKEKEPPEKKPTEEKRGSQTPPPRSSGGSGFSPPVSSQSTTPTNNISPAQTKTSHESIIIPSLLIAPLNNRSANVRGMDYITQKMNNQITRSISSLKIFKIISQQTLNEVLKKLKIDKFPNLADEETVKRIAQQASAQLFIFGHIKKISEFLEIKVHLVNTDSGQRLNLTSIREKSDDVFDIERKINWQINNALKSESSTEISDLPHTDEVDDLPI